MHLLLRCVGIFVYIDERAIAIVILTKRRRRRRDAGKKEKKRAKADDKSSDKFIIPSVAYFIRIYTSVCECETSFEDLPLPTAVHIQ